ncbi:MAG: DUF4239 domain-containing protein [Candidatus Eremiobacteraeota bacterium]|uniref:DUF4239 domain-containing protein n=1 Tax=mine drainage metagenome TaxID=410659 RepID=E6PHR9_9ZZZZ|nr:DUF4239 domain-containing protein [Candidatus Eremiobacteraeota bacterium]
MDWIYGIPTWLFAIVAISLACTLAAFGLSIFERRVSLASLTHNDVAGPIVTTIGTILAVILSFMVVTVWQEFDQAAATVQNEAAALGDLYHLCETLPKSFAMPLRSEIVLYVRAVVNREWPAMQHGDFSRQARDRAHTIMERVASFHPADARQAAVLASMLDLTNRFVDQRRTRLFDNQESIPPVLWGMMLFISLVTVAGSYLFRVQSRPAHYLMTILLAATIVATMVVIAELDLPFRGDVHISPTAFVRTRLATNSQL